jgi:hypothetical protein
MQLVRQVKMTKIQIAALIDSFLDGTCGEWDWDDFISAKLKDPELENVRERCAAVADVYPPVSANAYCSEDGVNVLRAIVDELRNTST